MNDIQMIKVYLKSPYKVLTIDQIKQKKREERISDSPLKMFRAEN